MRYQSMFAAALLAATFLSAPAQAQDAAHRMSGHDMSGMDHGHDMAAMPGMEHPDSSPPADAAPAPASPAPDTAPATVDDTPGNAPPPPIPIDHPAERFFPAERMAPARAALLREGRIVTGAIMLDQLEYRATSGRDGYGWKASAWYGGDIDRIVFATEGEGEFGHTPERAETRLVLRHALDPWWNLEVGVRHDFNPSPQRTYAAIGIEGLAPYWFELEGQVFVSDKGDVHLRLGGSHDMRLAGPLVLQPDAEVNVALQDVPAIRIGSGVERIELGARLRYEFTPAFAPYVGVHWERKLGRTADYMRADGERASAVSAVIGLRAWF